MSDKTEEAIADRYKRLHPQKPKRKSESPKEEKK